MKNVISFSLWGNNPLYTRGAINNADLALDVYPGWICYYFCNSCVPAEVIEELKSRKNTNVIQIESIGDNRSAMNRFLAVDFIDVQRAIFRDADSRVSFREKLAVDDWIASDADIHIMRDHPYHAWLYKQECLGLNVINLKVKCLMQLNDIIHL